MQALAIVRASLLMLRGDAGTVCESESESEREWLGVWVWVKVWAGVVVEEGVWVLCLGMRVWVHGC